MSKQKDTPTERIEAFLRAHPDLKRVELLLPDIHGILRGKWGPASALKKAVESGIQLPLSTFGLDIWGREVSETGLHIDTGDKDGTCLGQPETLRLVPWANGQSAQMLMAMHEANGERWFADPRHHLIAMTEKLRARGLTPVVAFESEFYLLHPTEKDAPQAVSSGMTGPDRQRMYSLGEMNALEPVLAEMMEAGRAQELPMDTLISEAGPGQFEINLNHKADPLGAADDLTMLRRLIVAVADKHDLRATFMAKPFAEWPGNGMHVHVSLVDEDGNNVFSTKPGEKLRLNAVAGLLETMPAMMAIFINSFNGYRRLAPGSYAPTRATWGSDNRSVAVRLPKGPAKANRLEHRIAGADANPYLVLTAILGGMLHGMDKEPALPQAVEGNAYEGAGGGALLDNDMRAAIDNFEKSAHATAWFGEEFATLFATLKRAEWQVFQEQITRLETETYL